MCMLNCDMYFMHINVSGRLVLLLNKLIDWSTTPYSKKSRANVAVCNLDHCIITGKSHAIWDHTVLSATTFPHLPQLKLVLDLATPKGCKAELVKSRKSKQACWRSNSNAACLWLNINSQKQDWFSDLFLRYPVASQISFFQNHYTTEIASKAKLTMSKTTINCILQGKWKL